MNNTIDHFLFFSSNITEENIVFDMEETKHAHSVLHLQKGNSIFITDGAGSIYFCTIEHIEKNSCIARILEKKTQEPPKPAMHFFIGLPGKNAFETALTGLVPLGVMHITPVENRYCQKKWWAKKWEKHADRFRKKMITAAKQSWNAWLPSLNKPVVFTTAINTASRLVFFADGNGVSLNNYNEDFSADETISCFVGPPGGFSSEENSELRKHGALPVKFSERRLRTELAATVMAGNLVQKFT